MRDKRNQYLDIIKACSCVMVVYVHSCNLFGYAKSSSLVPALSMLATCGVRIFFAVSGYLSISLVGSSYFDAIKKKFKSLLIPFVIWNFVYLIFEIIGHSIMPDAFEDIAKWTLKDFCLNFFGIPFVQSSLYGPLWFVRELLILFLIYPLIVLCVKHIPTVVLCIVFVMTLVTNMPDFYANGYYLKSSIPFFSLGLWIAMNQDSERKNKLTLICSKKEIVIGATFIAIVLSYVRQLYEHTDMMKSVLEYLSVFLFLPMIFWFGKYVEKTGGALSKLFLMISQYSFMIFVLHGKLLSIIQILCTRMIVQNNLILCVEYILLPMIVITIVILVSKFLSKRVPNMYRFLTGGR